MKFSTIIPVVLLLLFIVPSLSFGILSDWLWFLSIGYDSVFLKIVLTSLTLGVIAFTTFFAFSYVNTIMARRAALGKSKRAASRSETIPIMIIVAVVSLVAAVAMGNSWETVLKYQNYSGFGVTDPVFGMDIGFYVFTLPFYSLILNFMLAAFVTSLIFASVTYIIHSTGFRIEMPKSEDDELSSSGAFGSGFNVKWSGSWNKFLPQLSVLLFLIFMVITANTWLSRYGLLLSFGDAVYGAGFTDINVNLPLLVILSVVSFLIGVMFIANIWLRKFYLIKYGIAAFVIISVLGAIVGGAVQALVVNPDEFNLEKPFLERNIQGTLAAYGLEGAQEVVFPVNYALTSADVTANSATINNIRLWDWRPLKQTYNQLQLFRTYYEFNDVDVDRYQLDGMYKQVLVSAREMNTADLPSQAQTWVNKHLVYTHGYGVVMNPVDMVSPEGLPIFYLKDIPPTSTYLALDQMRIYFGEKTNDYVVTDTSTEELDFPSGDKNAYTTYSGSGGVPLSDFIRRLIYAAKFRSVELLVSGSLTPDSRLLMYRNIMERAPKITPFLSYDADPYIVVSGGRLFWIMDAYTTTDMYPYSEPVRVGYLGNKRINYIRNSVKVVVDAYNGDVRYYVVDPSDPVIQAYGKMFPGVFLDFGQMPDDLKAHVRYPEGIFSVQAAIYSTYHMKDPRVFYNKEDTWVTPDEIYRGSRQEMQPYYIIMKLPEEEREEFILMIPFTPKDKENMIGWMAARSDSPNYGKIIVYQFSKQELTYGPMQIEARIDQDTDISQLITLWSQSGSSVVRGNTLVIPIENSILYVEPLYLEATERGTLPQLQRVIVSYGNQLTMQETLSDALDVIFGSGAGQAAGGTTPPVITETDAEKLARIAELFDSAQEALKNGNLGLYQKYIEQIGELLPA